MGKSGSDYIVLVPLTGLEPVQCRHRGILSRYSFSEVSTPNWTILDFSAPTKCANCDKFRNYPISTDTKRQPSIFFSNPQFPLDLQGFLATWRDVGGMGKCCRQGLAQFNRNNYISFPVVDNIYFGADFL